MNSKKTGQKNIFDKLLSNWVLNSIYVTILVIILYIYAEAKNPRSINTVISDGQEWSYVIWVGVISIFILVFSFFKIKNWKKRIVPIICIIVVSLLIFFAYLSKWLTGGFTF